MVHKEYLIWPAEGSLAKAFKMNVAEQRLEEIKCTKDHIFLY